MMRGTNGDAAQLRTRISLRAGIVLAGLLAATLSVAPAAALAADAEHKDPWIGLNRPIFRFNDALDRYGLEPVAKGYAFITPDLVQGWITNFFANLWFPVNFTNCVLQAKPKEATQSLARFMINTTVGLGGFGDPASRLKIPAPNEDFGQTLGYWGVGTGPYLVLPLFGPSNIRDTGGRLVDSVNRVWPYFVPWYVSSSAGVGEIINTRARFLENVKDLRESSVDYYASVRDAYLQRRQALVEDRIGSDERRDPVADDDLYYPSETEPNTK